MSSEMVLISLDWEGLYLCTHIQLYLNLKLLSKLGFFALQGRHSAPIKVKFVTEAYTMGSLSHVKFSPGMRRGWVQDAVRVIFAVFGTENCV